MGKKAAGLVCIFLLMVILTGCQLIRIEEGERTPLKYTIVKTGRNPGGSCGTDGTEEGENISDDIPGGRRTVSDERIWGTAYGRLQHSGGGGF